MTDEFHSPSLVFFYRQKPLHPKNLSVCMHKEIDKHHLSLAHTLVPCVWVGCIVCTEAELRARLSRWQCQLNEGSQRVCNAPRPQPGHFIFPTQTLKLALYTRFWPSSISLLLPFCQVQKRSASGKGSLTKRGSFREMHLINYATYWADNKGNTTALGESKRWK